MIWVEGLLRILWLLALAIVGGYCCMMAWNIALVPFGLPAASLLHGIIIFLIAVMLSRKAA